MYSRSNGSIEDTGLAWHHSCWISIFHEGEKINKESTPEVHGPILHRVCKDLSSIHSSVLSCGP